MSKREVKEAKGYADIEDNWHVSRRDALISSVEILLEECSEDKLPVTVSIRMLEQNIDLLLDLLGQYKAEVQGSASEKG